MVLILFVTIPELSKLFPDLSVQSDEFLLLFPYKELHDKEVKLVNG